LVAKGKRESCGWSRGRHSFLGLVFVVGVFTSKCAEFPTGPGVRVRRDVAASVHQTQLPILLGRKEMSDETYFLPIKFCSSQTCRELRALRQTRCEWRRNLHTARGLRAYVRDLQQPIGVSRPNHNRHNSIDRIFSNNSAWEPGP